MENLLSIQQVSKKTGLSVHTLRYYEKIGLLSGVNRESNGYRCYTETDISWIDFLICLRTLGMPINQMKHFSDLRCLGHSSVNERLELLESHRENVLGHLKDLQESLGKIEQKIEHYKRL